MRAAGRPDRGERAKVAARVRDLMAARSPGAVDPAARTAEPRAWLPGAAFDEQVPRPVEASRLRWDPGRRGAAALGVLLVVVIAVTAWWLTASQPARVRVSGSGVGGTASSPVPAGSASPESSPGPVSGSPVARSDPATVVVDVAGKVRRPGLYSLPAGSRIDDALQAAGGVRHGVSTVSLNLAEVLRDGEQIVVGAPPGAVGIPGPAASTSSGAAVIVDLNTATLEQLETLPGVGPVLGQHILDWRDAHGRFTSIDQLRDVSGIGDVRFAELSPLVTT